MVNYDVLQKKLEKIDEYMEILESAKKLSFKELTDNLLLYGGVERYIQLCIEVLSDVANHIIASKKLGEVHWNQDVAIIFHEKGFISKELSIKWISMIKFRNLLVHEYAYIEKEKVYDILENHLSDIVQIQKVMIEQFL